ncbi:FUSC family protein [Azospirillum sp. ST 5-10]|uniref:FUSC family protein n=1 Tax=unclassified Azospirillum TaxID=2630922 RepID=UPI003F49D2F2
MSARCRAWRHGARSAAAAAAAGLAVPILAAAAADVPALGTAAAVGALAVAGGGRPAWRDVAAATAGGLAGGALAGDPWTAHAGPVALAAVAAAVGGYSRELAVAAARFVVVLLLVLNLAEARPLTPAVLAAMAAGALWMAALAGIAGRTSVGEAAAPPPRGTAAQRQARWRRTLATAEGWRFPIRLAGCLAIAEVVAALWSGHHGQWIALTVAILSRREAAGGLRGAGRRLLGTAAGLAVAFLLLARPLPSWGIALAAGALAAARSAAGRGDPLRHAAATTPLVLLLMSADAGTFVDRAVATALGAALVVASTVLVGGRTGTASG